MSENSEPLDNLNVSLNESVKIKWELKNKPHVCPICDGRGFVNSNFYNLFYTDNTVSTSSTETCRTCNGKGIIWS
jgi:DnaJ-class molecular chaperone